MRAALINKTRAFLDEPLNRTAVSLMAATVITAALGVLFWAVATRLFPAHEVGRNGALITAMMAIAVTFDLSVNNIVLRFFPQINVHLGRRVWQAYLLGGSAAAIGGALFVIFVPLASGQFDFLVEETAVAIGFPLAAAGWAIFVLQGSVLTALGKAAWLPVTNGAFAIAKIAAIGGLVFGTLEYGIFVGWVAPLVLVIPVVNWFIFSRVVPAAEVSQKDAPGVIEVVGKRRLVAFVSQDIVSTAAGEIATSAMPLIVVAMSGDIESAYFIVPFVLIEAFDMLFFSVAVSVVTEGARDQSRIPQMMKTAWRRLLTFTAPIALLIAIAAPLLLIPNGSEYMDNASTPLRFLALASIFRAIVMLYTATLRLQSRGRALFVVQIFNAAVIITAVILLTEHSGANGAALGWLIGLAITGTACLRPLLKFVRNPVIDPNAKSIDLAAEYEKITKRGAH